MAKKVSSDELKKWLSEFAMSGKLLCQIKNSHRWGKIDNIGSLGESFGTPLSAKEVFFPQEQGMFRFDLSSPVETLTEAKYLSANELVLWGIRPCEARALELIYRVFNEGNYKDVYFNVPWQNIIRVVVGCTDARSTCFCTSFEGGSPFGTQGVDILATKVDGDWILESISEKGEKLIQKFTDASESDMDRLSQIKKLATEKVDSSVPTQIAQELWKSFYKTEFWNEIGYRCIGCGVCTFVCPSCYCFDINDAHINRNAYRYRTWDGCQFGLFTLEASGHNPRPTQVERIRQRMMHKLSFFAYRYDGTQLCVGCGRCVLACPVNIDIREVARSVVK